MNNEEFFRKNMNSKETIIYNQKETVENGRPRELNTHRGYRMGISNGDSLRFPAIWIHEGDPQMIPVLQ